MQASVSAPPMPGHGHVLLHDPLHVPPLSCGTRTSRSISKTTPVCRPSTTGGRGSSTSSQRTACRALREGWSPRSWPCPSLILAVVCVRGAAFSARRSHQCREHPSSWTPGRVRPNENQTPGQRTWAGGQPWDKQPSCCGCFFCCCGWCGCCGCCFVVLLFGCVRACACAVAVAVAVAIAVSTAISRTRSSHTPSGQREIASRRETGKTQEKRSS